MGSTCIPACGAAMAWSGSACVPNCGAGTHVDAATSTCVADVTCGSGTMVTGGRCVPSSGACAPGTHLQGLVCVADAACGSGTHDVNGQCVPNDTCGAGTHDVNGQCVPNDSCGAGTHEVNGQCVPNDTCGPGTHDVNGQCVPGATACGTGTHFDAQSNSCLADVVCGPNTRAVQGVCEIDLGGHAPGQWSPNLRVSAIAANDGTALVAFEPQVAVAQVNGNINVAVVYPAWHGTWNGSDWSDSEIVTSVSHDGGATFPKVYVINSTDAVFNSPAWVGDPTVVAGGATVIIAFVAYRFSGCAAANGSQPCGELYFDYSQDGGDTWAGPQVIVTSQVLIDRPFWSLGLDGNAYLSFTWGQIVNNAVRVDTALIKVDANGNNTLLNHGLSGNLSFSALSQAPVVATAQGEIFGSLDQKIGDTYQLADVVAAPNDDSQPFVGVASRQSEEARDNDYRNLNQWLALSPLGEMSLVWRYNVAGATRIAVTTTTNGVWPSGLLNGWIVDDAPFTVSVNCAYPLIVSDEKGRWHAMWRDNRYGDWGTYTSSSSDGMKWSPSSSVADALSPESGWINPKTLKHDQFLGDYDSLVANFGQLFAAWVDTRSGTSQVYFSTSPNP
jgi:hypothetical protein